MVWNLKKHRRSLPTTENRIKVIAEGDFLVIKPRKTKGLTPLEIRCRRHLLSFRRGSLTGLTLLEIIISVAIFALVAAAVSLVFNRSLFVYRASTDKNAAAQEAQTATEWLLRDIQSAKDITTAKANEIKLAIPEDHIITHYLDSAVPTNKKIRRQQDGAPVPGHLVAEGVSRFSLKYYGIQNIELVPVLPDGLSTDQCSRIKTVEIDITTQKNTREFRLNTVARADYYPYYYWIKTYRLGVSGVKPYTVIQETRPDGGYIFAGTTEIAGDPDYTYYDILMIKIDPLGIIQWAKTYSTANIDEFGFLQQTPDGGYIIGGESGLWVAPFGPGHPMLIKTDSSGEVEWAKMYPFPGISNRPYALQQTYDGGYILAGVANQFSYQAEDCLVIKTDSNGGLTWVKTYDVWGDDDGLYSLQQTDDDGDGIENDGYILAGTTEPLSVGYGMRDGLVIKIDSSGIIQWAKTYDSGGCGDCLRSIQNISNGYILAGTSEIAMHLGYLLFKTDFQGRVGTAYSGTWAKRYGWSAAWQCINAFDDFYSLDQTKDGGYILGGIEPTGFGDLDAWAIKTNASGDMEWAKRYENTENEELFYSLQQDSRRGYIFAGYTQTSSEYAGDDEDEYEFLVARTDDLGNVPPPTYIIRDVTGDIRWEPVVTSYIEFAVESGITTNTPSVNIREYPGSGPDDPAIPNFTLTINDVSPRTDLIWPR